MMARGEGGDDVYVYAFTDEALPPRMRLRGRRLRTRTVGSLSAVVGAGRLRERVTAEALAEQHAIAAALAGRTKALLPARYGSILTGAALDAFLLRHAGAIQAALDHVRDRVQMTVRVFGEPDTSRPVESRRGSGTAYLESRRRLRRHLPPEIAAVRRVLGQAVADERAEAGEGRLRLTVYHLVPARTLQVYRRRARALQEELPLLEVTITGPWPPYAFSPELS